jgi:hypothetical protein
VLLSKPEEGRVAERQHNTMAEEEEFCPDSQEEDEEPAASEASEPQSSGHDPGELVLGP